jgi:hypothetical protein
MSWHKLHRRLFASNVRRANLNHLDETISMVVKSDTRMILQVQHHNNRHVQSPRVPLMPSWRFRKQIAEVVDDFRGAQCLSCTSFDHLASTTNSNIRAIKRA